MTKKLFIGIAIITVVSLFFSVCSFASNEDSKTVNLGNEVSKTIDKTEDNVENAADKTGNAGQRLVNDVKTDVGAMFDNTDNNNDNNKNNVATANTNNGNYTTTRTATNGNVLNTGMSSTTWIWIIMAVAAIIIIAAVWYYAAQNNTRSNS
jgi:ABC-type transport system involved in multi-copper enzyme maturation permease subunit